MHLVLKMHQMLVVRLERSRKRRYISFVLVPAIPRHVYYSMVDATSGSWVSGASDGGW